MKSKPKIFSAPVETLKTGDKLSIISSEDPNWIKVKSKNGKLGYVLPSWVGNSEDLKTAIKAIEKSDKLQEQALVLTAAERKRYAAKLREHFLDDQLDIKVWVSGSNNEQLFLRFVLFNDVWLHNFKKGNLIEEMKTKGFKRVELTDGYDWGYYFTFGD